MRPSHFAISANPSKATDGWAPAHLEQPRPAVPDRTRAGASGPAEQALQKSTSMRTSHFPTLPPPRPTRVNLCSRGVKHSCGRRDVLHDVNAYGSDQRVGDKVNSLTDARDLRDPETPSSSGASHVTDQPVTIPSTRTVLGFDSGFPHGTRNIMGISGNAFERPPAQQGYLQDYFRNSKNSAFSFCGVKRNITDDKMASGLKVRPEQQDSPRSNSVLHSGGSVLHSTSGTYSHGGTTAFSRFQIWELHCEKFPDSMDDESWKVSFKTEVLFEKSYSSGLSAVDHRS